MKNKVTVTIAEQEYTLIADQDAAAVEKIAAHVDSKVREVLAGGGVLICDQGVLPVSYTHLLFRVQ